MNTGCENFIKDAIEIKNSYPTLKLNNEPNSTPFIEGELPLSDSNGSQVDSYKIKLIPTEFYPYRFPNLFETGGKIPKNIDWHIYASDGRCCICTLPEEIIKCKSGINLKYFIEEEVKPFLFNQTFRRLNGYFYKERSHGFAGEFEFYFEIFKTNNHLQIVNYLIYIAINLEPNRVQLCFCGSGLKYRHCHREAFRAFTNISKAAIVQLILSIISSPPFLITYAAYKIRYMQLMKNTFQLS